MPPTNQIYFTYHFEILNHVVKLRAKIKSNMKQNTIYNESNLLDRTKCQNSLFSLSKGNRRVAN